MACVWLKRYNEEGIGGLKNKPKTGRPPSELSEETACRIKTTLKESSQQDWTTKQVKEMIIEKSEIKYHHTHPYIASFVNEGFKQKVPREVHVNTASQKENEIFKKRLPGHSWISSRKVFP